MAEKSRARGKKEKSRWGGMYSQGMSAGGSQGFYEIRPVEAMGEAGPPKRGGRREVGMVRRAKGI